MSMNIYMNQETKNGVSLQYIEEHDYSLNLNFRTNNRYVDHVYSGSTHTIIDGVLMHQTYIIFYDEDTVYKFLFDYESDHQVIIPLKNSYVVYVFKNLLDDGKNVDFNVIKRDNL